MAEVVPNKDNKSSYRGILKATSLFGGVKVYEILIEIIKSKFIALLLGPTGVGVQGLYTSGTQMIQQLTALGLSQSAVRNVAEANGSGEKDKINRVVCALRKLVWITGILGMITVIAFSPILSESSFGDSTHIWGFVFVSVTLLINQISAGQKVILQGIRKFQYLAKCSAIGVTIGLFVSIPLYYLWGIEAIVPNIIISSFTALLLSWYYSRKIQVDRVEMNYSEVISLGKTMITMGIAMSLSQLFTSSSAYVLRSFIRYCSGVEYVGLFTAGFLLMGQYTGLVFQAMSTDFYPRLAAVNQDNIKCREIMNYQGEIGLLMLGPLMVICVIFIPIVVQILYSEKFLAVNDYIVWCAVGVIFQMASWSISHIFIAKAESSLFIKNELSVGIYSLGFNLIGYYLGGLTGLGISFTIKYFFYLIQVYFIARKRYGFSFTRSFGIIFFIELLFVVAAVFLVTVSTALIKYVVGSFLCILVCLYSIIELNKKTGMIKFLTKHKNA